MAVAATPPTVTPLTELSVSMPWLIRVMALSCTRLRRSAGSGWPPALLKLSWNGSPYKVGEASR